MTDLIDAEFVVYRLEEAGRTLLALPGGAGMASVASGMPDVVRSANEAYGWSGVGLKPAVPSAQAITRMDEALAWILLIPLDAPRAGAAESHSLHGGAMLRRIVGSRCLIGPVTGRHLFSWRRLGQVMHANHESIRQWHARGIDRIVAGLRQQQALASVRNKAA